MLVTNSWELDKNSWEFFEPIPGNYPRIPGNGYQFPGIRTAFLGIHTNSWELVEDSWEFIIIPGNYSKILGVSTNPGNASCDNNFVPPRDRFLLLRLAHFLEQYRSGIPSAISTWMTEQSFVPAPWRGRRQPWQLWACVSPSWRQGIGAKQAPHLSVAWSLGLLCSSSI